ncbi:MAG TPA: hypothetical protein PKM44_11455 [Turneriella sp.]|nr:hypothetical protein [Turneriella sp.]HNE20364.1 hypothetical protein [Turneriella sp.]HNL11120.1 hypothetical protein [Turneriella sp.]HNL55273.1 hypothetical protein [Turneriella sp.]HNN01842.1 hypothetical protein [Turneriella sp.]
MESSGHDEWSRVSEYLDRLAFENDRLEAELRVKKQRRLEREAAFEGHAPGNQDSRFDEIAANSAYEARNATDATAGMHISYDALRRDLSGLMSDLNDFKSTRAGLEARLGA